MNRIDNQISQREDPLVVTILFNFLRSEPTFLPIWFVVERDSGVGLQNFQPEKAPLLEEATPSFLNNPNQNVNLWV